MEYPTPKGKSDLDIGFRATRILFICGKNRLRSPTAEQVFSKYPGFECASAGVNHDADNPVTPELLKWAEIIFVMEKAHRSKLSQKFRKHLGKARIVCLDISDDYQFMDPALVEILESKLPRFLPKA
ncbi:low molecular weight protein tyrosine phosphatase family protein [Derxia gummosa]|uniref:Low molecular weight protein tyrosine phosphatase family protein n=1 Tax=Derxia gummosa DSM 723 TaxID=1121388 RepID=A0A8B6X9M7_9BURK|nr:low molecular weight protein tyrosine phosphatase family protein [Derxia gummosa]